MCHGVDAQRVQLSSREFVTQEHFPAGQASTLALDHEAKGCRPRNFGLTAAAATIERIATSVFVTHAAPPLARAYNSSMFSFFRFG